MKISTINRTICGRDYKVIIDYSKKNQKFSLSGELPSDFMSVLDYPDITGETENKLLITLRSLVERYEESKKKSRKVILYSAGFSKALSMIPSGRHSFSGFLSEELRAVCENDRMYHADLISVRVDYVVAEEISKGEDKVYHSYEINDDNITYSETIAHNRSAISARGMTVISYSKEAADFFENMVKAFQDMAQKMAVFFAEKDEETIKILMTKNHNILK